MSTRTLRLTLPQLRMINAALAYYQADEHYDDGYREAVMVRTRTIVHAALGDDGP